MHLICHPPPHTHNPPAQHRMQLGENGNLLESKAGYQVELGPGLDAL